MVFHRAGLIDELCHLGVCELIELLGICTGKLFSSGVASFL